MSVDLCKERKFCLLLT